MHSHHDHAEGAPSASGMQPVAPEELAAARAVLARHQQAEQVRLEECAEKIQAVLNEYGVTIQAERPTISLIPLPDALASPEGGETH